MASDKQSILFTPLQVGDIEVPNRIWMAPLTRCRSGADRIPNDMMVEYYAQRAAAGLIITEATVVSPMGIGYADTPGIYNDEQVAGWKKITDAVHAAGGRIFLQLWHVGRISDPMFLNGELPVAPSAIRPNGHVSLVRPFKDYVVPRELNCPEIRGIVAEFKTAAENAKTAGFDGVEIHGANGYLLDQFLQDHSNARTDCWGGSIEHRARLLLEITDACIDIWGAGRVGVHLAPRGDQLDMGDNCPCKTFTYVASELGKRKIAFIFAREYLDEHRLGPRMKEAFGGVYIANEKFQKETAESTIEAGEADAVAFGKLFIANPDLVKRFEVGAGLNEWDAQTFYKGGAQGYIDYPTMEEVGGDGKQVVQDKSEGVAKVQEKIAEKTWPEKIAAQPDPEVRQAHVETRVH